MNLDLIEKHVHLVELPNGVEVRFGGQACLKIVESYDGGYSWRIEPLFAKLTYGANVFEDAPYCYEALETIEDAVAAGLSVLNDLGALYGVVDTPEDTFSVEGGVDNMTSESVEESVEVDYAASLMQDCRKEALKYTDSIMEAHDLAQGLYDSFIDEADTDKFDYNEWKKSTVKPRKPRGYKEAEALNAAQKKIDAARKPVKEESEELAEGSFNDSLKARASELVGKLMGAAPKSPKYKVGQTVSYQTDIHQPTWKDGGKGKGKITQYSNGHYIVNGNPVNHFDIKKVHESVDEAALSGDAYWKHKEAEAEATKAREERAKLGIKEPVKKGRGKPTNIDLEFVHAAAKKNLEAGKRPTAGMERNEKIHFVRHLSKHPDFTDHHVKAAGRPTGTTKAAKAEKEVEKKKEASAFSMWAGLGKK